MSYAHHTSLPAVLASPARALITDTSPEINVYRGASFIHTTASFRRDHIPELDLHIGPSNGTTDERSANVPTSTPRTKVAQSWSLSLPVVVPPHLQNPILESLMYNISYAAFGHGSAFFQTDIIISNGNANAPEGIITDYSNLAFYSNYNDEETRRSEGYEPPMLNEETGLCLGSRRSFKGPDISGWCHYADHQELYLDVSIGPGNGNTSTADPEHSRPSSRYLYLFFHVHESSCVDALRNIDVDVAATWLDGAESGRSREMAKEVDEIRRERQRLIVAKRGAEMMIRRLEDSARKANKESEERKRGEEAAIKEHREREERFLGIEKKAIFEHEKRTKDAAAKEADSRVKRDHAMRVGSENAILKVLVEVQKFREEVKQYRQEEAESRERMEAESKKRIDIEITRRMENERKIREEEEFLRAEINAANMNELMEAQSKFREEVEQYWHEEAEANSRMEVEEVEDKELERMTIVEVRRKNKESIIRGRTGYRKEETKEVEQRPTVNNSLGLLPGGSPSLKDLDILSPLIIPITPKTSSRSNLGRHSFVPTAVEANIPLDVVLEPPTPAHLVPHSREPSPVPPPLSRGHSPHRFHSPPTMASTLAPAPASTSSTSKLPQPATEILPPLSHIHISASNHNHTSTPLPRSSGRTSPPSTSYIYSWPPLTRSNDRSNHSPSRPPISSSQPPQKQKRRKGYWNRRGDHVTTMGYLIYAPPELVYPRELDNYPDGKEGGYMDHLGNRVKWVARPPKTPEGGYEKIIEYVFV